VTHDVLVQRAVRWLRGTMGCNVVLAEPVTALPVVPDAIGWRSGWSILVECKTSRGDFFADRRKPHLVQPDHGPGQERWYLTPPGLVQPEEVPEGWGLAEVRGSRVYRVKPPPPERRWSPKYDPTDRTRRIPERDRHDLIIVLSMLRRHHIGIEWWQDQARFKPLGAS